MVGLSATPELATRLAAYFVVFEAILLAATCRSSGVPTQVRILATLVVLTMTIIRFIKFYSDWEHFYAPFRA